MQIFFITCADFEKSVTFCVADSIPDSNRTEI